MLDTKLDSEWLELKWVQLIILVALQVTYFKLVNKPNQTRLRASINC